MVVVRRLRLGGGSCRVRMWGGFCGPNVGTVVGASAAIQGQVTDAVTINQSSQSEPSAARPNRGMT